MNQNFKYALLAIIIFTAFQAQAQEIFTDGIDLTTKKSPWTIRILGNDIDIADVQAKPDEQSAYFMMTSKSSKLNVSVFIEPIDKCKTSEQCRDYVLDLGNPQWGKFQDLAKGKIKDFSYFEFYRPEVNGKPLKILDMYAQYVSDGYWVDLHISKTLYTKDDHKVFEDLVNSVQFIPKNDLTKSNFDIQSENAKKSVSDWLSLWNNSKCIESYKTLSSITRSDINEKTWVDYCSTVNSALGKQQERFSIATAFTKSLPGKTDRPVAILAYHSKYENFPSMVEMIAVMQENDGKWVLTNYLTNIN